MALCATLTDISSNARVKEYPALTVLQVANASLFRVPGYEPHKGGKMIKPKLVVHESYKGKQRPEEVFAAVLLSAAGLTETQKSSIIKQTEQSQDSLCSRKGAIHGTSET